MNEIRLRSEFVSVVAWIFIVLTGFSTVMLLIQNLVLRTFFSDHTAQTMLRMQHMNGMPALAKFVMTDLNLVFLLLFLASLGTLVVSIGLLRRKNWARRLFIIFMAIGILWNLGSLLLQAYFMPVLFEMQGNDVPEYFMSAISSIRWVAFAMAIAFIILYGWIIKKLSSTAVKTEFAAA